jgi:hypothetical protein
MVQGSELDRLIAVGQLQVVEPNEVHAKILIRQATLHLTASESLLSIDGVGAYSLLYEAARKALTALLVDHGFRPTRTGGHRVIAIACADLASDELRPLLITFERMREVRNQLAYPSPDSLARDPQDVAEDLSKAYRIVSECAALITANDKRP